MAQSVRILTKDEKPSEDNPGGVVGGQKLEIDEKDANKLYPNAKILSNADGSPYKAPKSEKKD